MHFLKYIIMWRIQLSRNNDFYPGTNDRVMLLSGTIRSVLTALYLILLKLTTAKRVDGKVSQNKEYLIKKE